MRRWRAEPLRTTHTHNPQDPPHAELFERSRDGAVPRPGARARAADLSSGSYGSRLSGGRGGVFERVFAPMAAAAASSARACCILSNTRAASASNGCRRMSGASGREVGREDREDGAAGALSVHVAAGTGILCVALPAAVSFGVKWAACFCGWGACQCGCDRWRGQGRDQGIKRESLFRTRPPPTAIRPLWTTVPPR